MKKSKTGEKFKKLDKLKPKELRIYGFVKALTAYLILAVVVIAVSAYFVGRSDLVGPLFLGMGGLSLLMLKFYKIPLKAVGPDIVFGAIDNGVLVLAAVIGANFAGVFGAIVGGVAGNTITDGIGGLFEGNIAEHQREYKIDNLRTALSTCLGKMAGCLFGGGLVLIIFWFFGLV